MSTQILSIIIPMYNEEASLPYLYDRLFQLGETLTNYQLEFLFVDDGSSDQSLQMVKELRKGDCTVSCRLLGFGGTL